MTVIHTLTTDAAVRTAVEAAIRAPSPHNTQPWRFEVTENRIDVWLDRARVLPVADPDGREARISCGAAILNLRIALRATGRAAEVHLLPDRHQPEYLATVRIAGPCPVSPPKEALYRAISYRRTNRRPFTDQPVPARVRHALVQAALAEGGELLLLERPRDLDTLATLLRRAETVQSTDPAFQAELARWTVGGERRDDGVPLAAGGPRPDEGSLLALRLYGDGGSTVDKQYERAPLVAVLNSHTDTPLAQVRAGQAMQRVLLTAQVAGVSASFLSQPVEVPACRATLRTKLGGRSHPQVVLRFGYGFVPPSTARRSITTVTREQETS